jgi:hypothetical protein
MGDQPITRLLATHRTTQTLNKHTDIHASSEIQTHDTIVFAGETVRGLDRAIIVIGPTS